MGKNERLEEREKGHGRGVSVRQWTVIRQVKIQVHAVNRLIRKIAQRYLFAASEAFLTALPSIPFGSGFSDLETRWDARAPFSGG